ncbi:hypothetical protein COT27_02400 [Candidatus Kuenenbacteria bacterium CG08_land_8_20_14_0_20_37_23]|uniref:Uncharacterized protein n=1 Tax=Candidatus Kuenenbacteria bacterium CG08_land_8_20_14_0_20_37_23 TaxID=1974617 RepID=A0A2M6XSF8_9BACT|nr:MAG: hypothetical protein COT27_02400 [Candidatus Kuenenbacteria bacterium CG08_land_8_20_14_0_20_37_23]
MTTNEQKILEIIWNWGGEAPVDIIAREAGISIEYTRLLCEELGEKDYVNFLHTKLCKIKSKGKSVVAKSYTQKPKKIVIPEISGKFGSGRDKRGRMILGY